MCAVTDRAYNALLCLSRVLLLDFEKVCQYCRKARATMKARYAVLFAACLLAGKALSQSSTAKEYPVPGHGFLRMNMPLAWKVEPRAMADLATLFLHISPTKGNSFDAQITVVWLNAANLGSTTPESIKANTERTGNGVLLQAVEKTLTLRELRGVQTFGTYYSLTDRIPAPGEFKHITQGSFLTGELLCAFTIHSESPNPSEVKQLMRIFSEATHVKPAA